MAGGYDGSIKIDTRISGEGFNSGIQKITGTLTKLAAAVGLAFGLGQVIAFGKGAVDAASQMSNALIGLQSILQGQGRSFADAKKFIDSYIADGLIPAGNAITAYKNLASRGYADTQIQQVMLRLKDAASFGRQASYTLGDAVQTATEGLKNENSILVDNAGVTKNVAKMWEDYAKSQGKSAQELTKNEKILAEVNGIMEETRFQVGDAAKVAQTYSGKVASLSASFLNFKVAIGNAIIPAISAVLPYVTQLITWLTAIATTFGQVSAALFGTQAADSTKQATAAQDDLTDATKKTEKAARKSLAAFDEINILNNKAADAAEEKAAITEAAGGGPTPSIIPPEILAQVEAFKAKIAEILGPLQEPLTKLKDAILELGGTIWDGLKWAWDNILVPFGEWLMKEAAPVFIDLLTAGIETLNSILEASKPGLQWLWDNFLKPIAEWTGGAILDVLQWITERLRQVSEAITEKGWLGLIEANWNYFKEIVGKVWDWLKERAAEAWGWVVEKWGQLGEWFRVNVTEPLGNWFAGAWENVKTAANDAWLWVQGIWGAAGAWFNDNIANPVKGAFQSVLDWLPGAWENAFNGVVGFVKNAANSVIDFINGMISAIASGINAVIGALNGLSVTIPDWVPGFGGASWGLNLPYVNAPQIPRLATGAVVPAHANMLAMVGEGSKQEIVAPSDTIRQIVREEMQNAGNGNINITFEGSLSELARVLRPAIERDSARVGSNLIQGVTPA